MTHPWTDHMNAHPFTHDEPLTTNTVNPVERISEERDKSVATQSSSANVSILAMRKRLELLEDMLEWHTDKGGQLRAADIKGWIQSSYGILE